MAKLLLPLAESSVRFIHGVGVGAGFFVGSAALGGGGGCFAGGVGLGVWPGLGGGSGFELQGGQYYIS